MTNRHIPRAVKAVAAKRQARCCAGFQFDVDEVIRLYRTGMSIRSVATALGTNRESVRLVVKDAGYIRGRLDFHGKPHDRILAKIDYSGTNGCWLWLGPINNKGYGLISLNGRKMTAHRAVYQLLVGDIPADLDACHHCDNPACVNPDHIFIGTRTDNMQDAIRKGRLPRGGDAPNATLTADQVRAALHLVRSGVRICDAARKLRVPYKTLWGAVRGKTWLHIRRKEVA